jgi:hypothetical protein
MCAAYGVDEVEAFDEVSLGGALQEIDDSDNEVVEVVPHRSGKNVDASIVSKPRAANAIPLEWHVERAEGYGAALAGSLQRLSNEGWDIFAIIPHRVRTDNFPEIIVHRPK